MSTRTILAAVLLAALFLTTGAAALFAESGAGKAETKSTGSIAIPSEESVLAKLAKVTLVDAVQAAVKHTPGRAIAAELDEDDGFLVYEVEIVTADDKLMEVTVDAGNSKVLKSEVEDEDDEDEDNGRDIRGKDRGQRGGEDD